MIGLSYPLLNVPGIQPITAQQMIANAQAAIKDARDGIATLLNVTLPANANASGYSPQDAAQLTNLVNNVELDLNSLISPPQSLTAVGLDHAAQLLTQPSPATIAQAASIVTQAANTLQTTINTTIPNAINASTLTDPQALPALETLLQNDLRPIQQELSASIPTLLSAMALLNTGSGGKTAQLPPLPPPTNNPPTNNHPTNNQTNTSSSVASIILMVGGAIAAAFGLYKVMEKKHHG